MRFRDTFLVSATLLALLAIAPGCAREESVGEVDTAPAATKPAATFGTPEEAVTAMVAALERRDRAELTRLLGLESDELLLSGDPVADSTARATFLARYHEKNRLVGAGGDRVILLVGADDWPFAIPIVHADGAWHLDGAEGIEEIAKRRIGANELHTIDVMRGYVVAQDEYAAASHDGVPAGTYARRLRSDPGTQNGLYWETAEGEPESPAGPFLAAASGEGYAGDGSGTTPYHGYRYRLLTAQGPSATGGARDYLEGNHLAGGFAAIAWPASYGESGVMTFLVNQEGVVWQKDLGEGTEQAAAGIASFDPDSTWTPLPEEE
jgi:hypothetical protein